MCQSSSPGVCTSALAISSVPASCVCVCAFPLCRPTVTPACPCRQHVRGSVYMLHIRECPCAVQRGYEHNTCVPTAICMTLGFRKGEGPMALGWQCQAVPPSVRQFQ